MCSFICYTAYIVIERNSCQSFCTVANHNATGSALQFRNDVEQSPLPPVDGVPLRIAAPVKPSQPVMSACSRSTWSRWTTIFKRNS
ncbi:hypothetical protein AVEN_18606-1 [Araneus ventricosus]|uniref:Uncharacterized protein n=1 Tax=Araneus ventricosus TaxID=182803 RepID=A0A4Y2FSV1_ARAVE|nr:hypothetical protein AVEN_18606-1 [Araneus ventricosus]